MAENLEDKMKVIPGSETPTSASQAGHLTQATPSDTKRLVYPLVGSVIDGVQIDKGIGKGGMGDVYHGLDPVYGEVAVKVLQSEHLGDDSEKVAEMIERFKGELEASKHLKHPHIAEVLKFGQMQDEGGSTVPFLISRYISHAGDLSQIRLSLEENATVLLQVAQALEYSHSDKDKPQVIHRDLKPQNILVTKPLHAYLIDFGLGRVVDIGRKAVTVEKGFLGTPDYMSPEQAADPQKVTHKTDIYSWALTAYAVFSQRRPVENQKLDDLSSVNALEKIKARSDVECMHEFTINESIDLKLKDLESEYETANEKRKGFIQSTRERLAKLSEPANRLFMRILYAKKVDDRPAFSMIIPELESLIEHHLVQERELTADEKKERNEYHRTLEVHIQKMEEELRSLDEKTDVEKFATTRYNLAQAITALGEIADDQAVRASLYQTAAKYASNVRSIVDVQARAGMPVHGISFQEVKDLQTWIASGINYDKIRKQLLCTRETEQEYDEGFKLANENLDKDSLVDAANNYARIDYSKIHSDTLKANYVNLTQRFEGKIDTVLHEGNTLLLKDLAAAELQLSRAQWLRDVLPKFSEARNKVREFEYAVNVQKFSADYRKHEDEKNYFEMLRCAKGIEDLLKKDEFPADRKEATQRLLDKYFEGLQDNRDQLNQFVTCLDNMKNLKERFKKEPRIKATPDFSEDVIEYVPKEKIQNSYKSQLELIGKTLEPLTPSKVGEAQFNDFKSVLMKFKEDIQAEVCKPGILSGSYSDRWNNLNYLIELFHGRGDLTQETTYLKQRTKLDLKRLGEILEHDAKKPEQ